MKDRIIKSWETTLIGALLIIGAITLVFLDKATLTEAGTFIVIGGGLFFAKNKKS